MADVNADFTRYYADYTGGKRWKYSSRYRGRLEFEIECSEYLSRDESWITIVEHARDMGSLEDWKLYFRWALRVIEAAQKEHFKDDKRSDS